jgi:queuine/archaeosine tRNA-ribosyltransferase
MLGPILVSLHNIRFYPRRMDDICRVIANQRFEDFRRNDPRGLIGPALKENV